MNKDKNFCLALRSPSFPTSFVIRHCGIVAEFISSSHTTHGSDCWVASCFHLHNDRHAIALTRWEGLIKTWFNYSCFHQKIGCAPAVCILSQTASMSTFFLLPQLPAPFISCICSAVSKIIRRTKVANIWQLLRSRAVHPFWGNKAWTPAPPAELSLWCVGYRSEPPFPECWCLDVARTIVHDLLEY